MIPPSAGAVNALLQPLCAPVAAHVPGNIKSKPWADFQSSAQAKQALRDSVQLPSGEYMSRQGYLTLKLQEQQECKEKAGRARFQTTSSTAIINDNCDGDGFEVECFYQHRVLKPKAADQLTADVVPVYVMELRLTLDTRSVVRMGVSREKAKQTTAVVVPLLRCADAAPELYCIDLAKHPSKLVPASTLGCRLEMQRTDEGTSHTFRLLAHDVHKGGPELQPCTLNASAFSAARCTRSKRICTA